MNVLSVLGLILGAVIYFIILVGGQYICRPLYQEAEANLESLIEKD